MEDHKTIQQPIYPLGIDIGSTTVKVAVLNEKHELLFSDYERHFADIQNTLANLLDKAFKALGPIQAVPVITGSGGLTLANHLEVPFVQEVIAVSSSWKNSPRKQMSLLNLAAKMPRLFILKGEMWNSV